MTEEAPRLIFGPCEDVMKHSDHEPHQWITTLGTRMWCYGFPQPQPDPRPGPPGYGFISEDGIRRMVESSIRSSLLHHEILCDRDDPHDRHVVQRQTSAQPQIECIGVPYPLDAPVDISFNPPIDISCKNPEPHPPHEIHYGIIGGDPSSFGKIECAGIVDGGHVHNLKYDPALAHTMNAEMFVKTENVNHPSHYNQYQGLEIIDLVEQMNFNRGNAVKYIARAGFKGGPELEVEDLKKAAWYLTREIERLGG